ncbi:PaaI family thioesterase [Caulobacter sp.]|uniref:PaaI family thioesterase n=1 Tax=Caulobacter sp. TaxID=78 RepID=UPI001B00B6F1|nr:PaaI family thioesterase [Caulobacter sp.]MBO9545486.1 PaaI family thioesterase [Caulobacter sp.]
MTWATERLDELKAGAATPPPIVQTLRLGLIDDWGEGWVRKSWTPAPELATADGSLFGGYLAALADQVLAFAAMTVVPGDRLFRTVNLQVNFLKIAREGPLAIEAKVVARTRQLITARAEFRREDGVLIAEATAQQIVMSFEQWPAEKAAIEGLT